MNSAIEFHDSEVQGIELSGEVVRVVFSKAYIHVSAGTPGADAGEGFTQPVDVVFHGASASGDADLCVGSLVDGHVAIGEKSLGLLPLPYSVAGNVTAQFTFASGAVFCITAKALECNPTGFRTFVEAYGA